VCTYLRTNAEYGLPPLGYSLSLNHDFSDSLETSHKQVVLFFIKICEHRLEPVNLLIFSTTSVHNHFPTNVMAELFFLQPYMTLKRTYYGHLQILDFVFGVYKVFMLE